MGWLLLVFDKMHIKHTIYIKCIVYNLKHLFFYPCTNSFEKCLHTWKCCVVHFLVTNKEKKTVNMWDPLHTLWGEEAQYSFVTLKTGTHYTPWKVHVGTVTCVYFDSTADISQRGRILTLLNHLDTPCC